MVNAQSIIESQTQGEFKSSLFANQVRTVEVVLMKTGAQTTSDSVCHVLDIIGNLRG
jgi:hypothetical protein